MSLATLRARFDSLLGTINGSTTTNFSTTVENAYEAVALAHVMNEYKRIFGPVRRLVHPINNKFLNQSPGKFRIDRSFKVEFLTGLSFYFAADIEVFGLLAQLGPVGDLFEADVVVIPEIEANDVLTNYRGYPAPRHIHSIYECKFGSYHKGQLRELLGLKRHLCFLAGKTTTPVPATAADLFGYATVNSAPNIPLKLVRPRRLTFFNANTSRLYDLQEIVV